MKGWTVGVLILVTLFPKDTFSQSGAPVHVLVNQQATLFRNISGCENAQFSRILPIEATIATCPKQQCTIKESLLKKFKFEDNNLVLKSAKYIDWGTYECICNGIKTYVKWNVVVPLKVEAQELGNITFLCFAKDAKDVMWFHNDAEVLHRKINGSTNIGNGFQNRALLKDGAFEDGNLSLTLLDVREKDAGLFLCLVNDETTEGYPYAHMLQVKTGKVDLIWSYKNNHSSPVENQADFSTALGVFIFVIIVLSFIIVVLSVKLYKLNCIIRTSEAASQSTSTRTSPSVEESERNPTENDHMLAVPRDESRSAQPVAQPVQESEIDIKSSSTQPF